MEGHNLFEVIDAVQSADLKKEEERVAQEKAARLALRAQSKPGTMNMSQLLDKMYGSGGTEQMTVVVAPKATKENTDGQPQAPASNVVAAFPPPPTGKR